MKHVGFTKLLMVMLVTALAACGRDSGGGDSETPKPTDPVQTPDDPTEPEQKPDEDVRPFLFLDPLSKESTTQVANRAWWLEKASRRVRGKGLTGEERQAWRDMSVVDVTEKLVEDSAFIDTTLKFGLHFFGVPRDSVRRYTNAYIGEIFNYPAVLTGARSLVGEGEFLDILNWQHRFAISGLSEADMVFDPDMPDSPDLPLEERRAYYKQKIFARTAEIQALLASDAWSKEGACSLLFGEEEFTYVPFFGGSLFDAYGMPESLTNRLAKSKRWFGGMLLYCFLEGSPEVDLVAQMNHVSASLNNLFSAIKPYEDLGASVRDLRDLQNFDLVALQADAPGAMTARGLYANLPNSSTNYNRKRAAFILKRYFCDDLTPINVVAPDDHASDAHAAEPGCQSCHFKLDPMAGFFKDIGFGGESFAGNASIVFDDGAQVDLEEYQSNWKHGEQWNIGFVRSSHDESMNIRGETIEDLFEIIKTAPEVKQCLVRRMFEFYVAENQVIDGAYLDHLTTQFTEESKQDSTRAYKNLTRRLVLSRTFMQPDPISNQCYDQTDHAGNSGPPCEIRHILQKNCVSCHSATSAGGGLDVTSWVKAGDKASFWHQKGGQQIDSQRSFEVLNDRLTIVDLARRMPLNSHMPTADRDQLFLWIQEMMTNGEKN